jgi:hypothetical protein
MVVAGGREVLGRFLEMRNRAKRLLEIIKYIARNMR